MKKTKGRHKATSCPALDRRVPAILAELQAMGNERNRAGMARYGINVANAFGVSIYELRKVAYAAFGTFRYGS